MLECTDIAFLTLEMKTRCGVNSQWKTSLRAPISGRERSGGETRGGFLPGVHCGEGLVDVPAVKLPKEKVIDTPQLATLSVPVIWRYV